MVHALKEAWRVLKPHGLLIDLRPICADVPLRVLTMKGWKSAGMVNRRELRIHDVVANRAILSVVNSQHFKKLSQKYFDVAYYWNGMDDLKTDAEGSWREDLSIADETWKEAQALLTSDAGGDNIQISMRTKITRYQKLAGVED